MGRWSSSSPLSTTPLVWALGRGRIWHSVILTEGAFDREVLERAVTSAYPHLQDYLRFIDPAHVVERNATALVTFVHTLLAAGVQNPNFIAVFDNDAEGAQAAARLAEKPLPTGYRICTLPDVAGLCSVPVLLLNQVELRDANGWGAAIEMYLALDLGQPLPTLTLSKMGKTYQGVLEQRDKTAIQTAARARPDVVGDNLRRIVDAVLRGDADLQSPNRSGDRLLSHPLMHSW